MCQGGEFCDGGCRHRRQQVARSGRAAAGALDRPWPMLCTGLRCHGESFASLGPMTATSLDVVSSLEASIDRSSFFCAACLPWVKTWTFWSGDSGVSGIEFLLRGVVFGRLCSVSLLRRPTSWQGRWRSS
jgi:hypothetical protein